MTDPRDGQRDVVDPAEEIERGNGSEERIGEIAGSAGAAQADRSATNVDTPDTDAQRNGSDAQHAPGESVVRDIAVPDDHSPAEGEQKNAGIDPKDLIETVFRQPLNTLFVILGIVFVYALFVGIMTLIYLIFTFVVIILIDYREYDDIEAPREPLTLALGALLMLGGLFLDSFLNRFMGYSTAEGFGARDFVPFLMGLLLFLYGFGSFRTFFVPLGISFSFLAITLIPRTSIGADIHEPFVNFSVEGSMRLMELTDHHIYNNGARITMIKDGPPGETVVVSRGCSGFESTTYFGIFGSFLLWKLEGERWKKLLIVIIGIVGLLLMNIFRITLLILMYFWYDMGMLEAAHTNLGNILFFIWVGFIWWVSFTYILPAPVPTGEGRDGAGDDEGTDAGDQISGPVRMTNLSSVGLIVGTVHGSGMAEGICGSGTCPRLVMLEKAEKERSGTDGS